MNELPPTEPPRAVRRRSLLGISGWMLVVCLFLPTLRVCNDPVMPISFPPTYVIYFGGIVLGIIGFSTTHGTRRGGLLWLLGLWMITLFAIAAIWAGAVIADAVGFMLGAALLVVFALAMRRAIKVEWSERAIALNCFLHALISLGWSALLAFDHDGLWGATVSLGAASLMLFASGGYFASELNAATTRAGEPEPLPEARVL